jgi:two-component system, OmpR family, sensor kinase
VPLPTSTALPLRLRLTASFTLLLVIIIAALGAYLLTSMERTLLAEADETLALRSRHVERSLLDSAGEGLITAKAAAALQDVAPADEFAAPGLYVFVVDPAGQVVATSPSQSRGQLPAEANLTRAALAGREVYADVPVGQDHLRVLARPLVEGNRVVGAVLVGESMHLQEVALSHMRQLLVFAAALAAAVSLLGGWWLTGRAVGPVAEVTRVARRIAATGQFAQRLAVPSSRDELGQLAATFNDMLARLEKTFLRQRGFIADASHELRGPLMVIRGNLDLLKLDLPPEDRLACIAEATEEVERMSRLVSDLLFLSEVDAQETVRHQPVALETVVASIWQRARDLDGGAHQVLLGANDPATVDGDQERLGQLLWNLVENALRYTPDGGSVTIALRRQGDVAELLVSDTGIGIAAEHLPRLFERFYRVDRARSRREGGTGLGLAIAKQVAAAHGGQIRVRSEPGLGSTFTVALPVLKDAAGDAPGL